MLDIIKNIQASDLPYIESWGSELSFDIPVPPKSSVAFIDWLRCTNTDIKSFYEFAKYAMCKLQKWGFEIFDTGRGMSGYTHCFAILLNGERVGCFAADALDKMGGMFELTGTGCNMLQTNWVEWCSMIFSLKTAGFNITRLDVSSDFKGVAWHNYNKNIVKVLKYVKDGGFRVGNRGGMASIGTNGDWSDFIAGSKTSDTYVPALDCPAGLSFNVGKRDGVNSFIVYEKAKEMLGKGAFETLSAVDASWLRIERRFSRGTGRSKIVVPFEFCFMCDDAFFYNCEGLKSFVWAFQNWLKGNGVDPHQFDSNIAVERVGMKQGKTLLRKAFWAGRHAGRLLATLIGLGFTAQWICDTLIADKPIDGFIDNLTDCDDVLLEFKRLKYG